MSDIKLPPHVISTDHPEHPKEKWSVAEMAWIAARDRTFLAYARAAIEAQRVPDGWVLVNRVATSEMIEAAESVEDLYRRGTPNTWAKVWSAMLAESPAAPPVAQPVPNIAQIATDHGKRVGNLWHFDDLALSIFASKVMGLVSLRAQPAERKPLTEEQIREAVTAAGMMFTHPDLNIARAIERAHGIGD